MNYMMNYRNDIERIIVNLGYEAGRGIAWRYCTGLHSQGLINLIEWNILVTYTKEYRKSYEEAGI